MNSLSPWEREGAAAGGGRVRVRPQSRNFTLPRACARGALLVPLTLPRADARGPLPLPMGEGFEDGQP